MTSRVERLLGAQDLRRVVDRIAQRIQRGAPLTGPLTIRDATDDERSALGALIGRGPTSSVRLETLDQVVRNSGAASSLAEAVAELRGPLVPRAEALAAERERWRSATGMLEPLLAARPDYADWADRIITTGLIRRLAPVPEVAGLLLERVGAVLAELPSAGESLPVLAARTLGDAHALDDGRGEATLVLAALSPGGARDADARRRAWAGVGVALDALSSTVLVHRLPLTGSLGDLMERAEPAVLTLRQVRAGGLVDRVSGADVFVCENPSVVEAAADALGVSCAPLVCVAGQPSLAALLLLDRLTAEGAVLRYHGDFDWGGIRIANRVHERVGFVPWRYRARDLDAGPDLGGPLLGEPIDAYWDPELRPTLERRGSGLQEEQVMDALLADLAAGGRRPRVER